MSNLLNTAPMYSNLDQHTYASKPVLLDAQLDLKQPNYIFSFSEVSFQYVQTNEINYVYRSHQPVSIYLSTASVNGVSNSIMPSSHNLRVV